MKSEGRRASADARRPPASPVPASTITVNIGVSQSGSWGSSVAVPVTVSGATATYTIATSDDNVDDGSVTATVQSGSGYTIVNTSSASVNNQPMGF